MARVRSALRTAALHSGTEFSPEGTFTLDGLVIDYGARRVFLDQSEIRLTHTEFDILSYLSRCSGKVVTYSAIIKEIWGYSDSGSIKKLQVNMANIRKKLGAKPGKKNYIENELGIGYRM